MTNKETLALLQLGLRVNLSTVETGCLVDGECCDDDRFNSEVIGWAVAHGFEPEPLDNSGPDTIPNWRVVPLMLENTAADAVAWLNEQNLKPGCLFAIEEKRLMYKFSQEPPC